MEDLVPAFEEETHQTKTRGERTTPAAHIVGAVCALVLHCQRLLLVFLSNVICGQQGMEHGRVRQCAVIIGYA